MVAWVFQYVWEIILSFTRSLRRFFAKQFLHPPSDSC